MRKMYIFVDDLRSAPHIDEDLFIMVVCRTYNASIDTIQYCHDMGFSMILDLDHDLGEYKTGYDVAKFIIENEIAVDAVHIHSMNPVGAANMRQLLIHYGYMVI